MEGTTQDVELARVKKAMQGTRVKQLRPSACLSHMRRTLAKEFQGIVDGFVEAAKTGSCPHVKLATELMKPDAKSSLRKKGSVAKYMQQLEKERKEKEQL
jgi:hypothetical protein